MKSNSSCQQSPEYKRKTGNGLTDLQLKFGVPDLGTSFFLTVLRR